MKELFQVGRRCFISIYFFRRHTALSVGIIGAYIGKIYKETKQRPKLSVEKAQMTKSLNLMIMSKIMMNLLMILCKSSASSVEIFAQYKNRYCQKKSKLYPTKILDFGCGDGISCELLKKAFPQSEVVGWMCQKRALKCKEKNCGCEFFAYNGQELTFEAEEFDLIFSSCVLSYYGKGSPAFDGANL